MQQILTGIEATEGTGLANSLLLLVLVLKFGVLLSGMQGCPGHGQRGSHQYTNNN